MCGRYTAAKDFSELIKLVGIVMARVPFFAPRYNIAPTQMAPVIYYERHQFVMKLMRWGLIPSWAKDESVGNAHLNARSETATGGRFQHAQEATRQIIVIGKIRARSGVGTPAGQAGEGLKKRLHSRWCLLE